MLYTCKVSCSLDCHEYSLPIYKNSLDNDGYLSLLTNVLLTPPEDNIFQLAKKGSTLRPKDIFATIDIILKACYLTCFVDLFVKNNFTL